MNERIYIDISVMTPGGVVTIPFVFKNENNFFQATEVFNTLFKAHRDADDPQTVTFSIHTEGE